MKYTAFISYSHAHDSRLAEALQNGLHEMAKNWEPLDALKVFLDDSGLLIGGTLNELICDALDRSAHLILLASPSAAQSPWVRLEIERFISKNPVNSLLIVHTAGSLDWDDSEKKYKAGPESAFPDLEHQIFAAEPRHLDLSWAGKEPNLSLTNPRFLDAVATLAASLQRLAKEDILNSYAEELPRLRRTARINLGFRGAIGFGGSAALAIATLAYFKPISSDLVDRSLRMWVILATVFAATGCLGGLSLGLGWRGCAGWAAGFMLLLPFYELAGLAPATQALLTDSTLLFAACVSGFTLMGVVGGALTDRRRWKARTICFMITGLLAAVIWAAIPDWRSDGIATTLLGPWQIARLQLAGNILFSGTYFPHLAPFVIASLLGGLLLGLQIADERIKSPLPPKQLRIERHIPRFLINRYKALLASTALAAIILCGASCSKPYQAYLAAERLRGEDLRAIFYSETHVDFGVSKTNFFRLLLRFRNALRNHGRSEQAAGITMLLNRAINEYAGDLDTLNSDRDGIAEIAELFVAFGAHDELRNLLDLATASASGASNGKPSLRPSSSPKQDKPKITTLPSQIRPPSVPPPIEKLDPSADGLISSLVLVEVAAAWRIYGDGLRSGQALSAGLKLFELQSAIPRQQLLDYGVAVAQSGNLVEAKALLRSALVGAGPDDWWWIHPRSTARQGAIAAALLQTGTWDETLNDHVRQQFAIVVAEGLLRDGKSDAVIRLLHTPGAVDFINADFASLLSLAVSLGQPETAFAMLGIIQDHGGKMRNTRIELLESMAQSVRGAERNADPKELRAALRTELQIRINQQTAYATNKQAAEISRLLVSLAVIGDYETLTAMTGLAGQSDYTVAIALASRLVADRRMAEAQTALAEAWEDLYLHSGYLPKTAGPLDQIAGLLVTAGDWRAARMIAEDFSANRYDTGEIIKAWEIYCSILEASDH